MRTYDHEQDKQEIRFSQHNKLVRQQFDNDYNFSKFTSEINELNFQVKSHDALLKKMQREIDNTVTQSHLTETIAFVNAGIHPDPNMVKLLKTREDTNDYEDDKVKMNASLLARKLNQMSQSLSVLLGGLKRLENKIVSVQAELGIQVNQKITSLQLHVEQARGQSNKQTMEVTQKMELLAFEVNDKLRDIQTKVNWKLNDFKTKLDEKINEEMVLMYLDNAEKKIDKNMRDFQIKSNIDPDRIENMERQMNQNRLNAQNQITECSYVLKKTRQEIKNELVRLEDYSVDKVNIQKRLNLFNENFMDVYKRVIKCQAQEVNINNNITKLLTDDHYALEQLKRINNVLKNLKISDDFQRMLEEMNPAKVLQLQRSVDGVKLEQNSIFGEIALAKREIAMIGAKSENMGFIMPNNEKGKLKKEEIYQALDSFLKENQFAQKISSIDRQVTDYKNSMDAVVTLSRQVARLQKQSDYQRLSFQLKNLQQYFKKQLALINNRFKQKYNNANHGLQFKERAGTMSKYSNSDSILIGQATSGRSFSTKKLQQITALNVSKNSSKNLQMIEIKASKNR